MNVNPNNKIVDKTMNDEVQEREVEKIQGLLQKLVLGIILNNDQ